MARRSNAARRDASAARRREGIRSQPLRAERRGVLQVAGAALLWSLGGIGIKAIAEPPLKIAAYRSASAAVVLFLLFRRSEEHTSELQSPCNLVCRLLLEKKNKPGDRRRLPPHI